MSAHYETMPPVTVSTASRSPTLPTYVSRAEGSIPCPLSIKYRNFHIDLDDYEVQFVYQDYTNTFSLSPLQGSATILKVKDAYSVPKTPQSTPATPPYMMSIPHATASSTPPLRPGRPRLAIRIPHPEMTASPQTPSPLDCDGPEVIVEEFLACSDEFIQAATNQLNNRTWLPNTIVTQLLLWLPQYMRE